MNPLFYSLGAGKVYYPDTIRGVQLNPLRQVYLISTLYKYAQQNKSVKVLEIGSWIGLTSILICSHIKEWFKSGSLVCCDMWEPYNSSVKTEGPINNTQNVMDTALDADYVFNLFKYNLQVSGYWDMVTPIIGDSGKTLNLLKNDFDIIFIDGDHKYDKVKQDIIIAKTLLKDGGLICGDDLEIGWSICDKDLDISKSCISGNGTSVHPGVSKAVYEELGIDKSYAGFWVAQKNKTWDLYDLTGTLIFKPPFTEKELDNLIVDHFKGIKGE